MENTQKKWANYMAVMSLIGLILFLLPWIAYIDPMDGGGALFMVGLLLALTGLITFFMFRSRAKQMDDILNNRKIIARWKVDSMEWSDFIEKDISALKGSAFSTWLIITFFFVLFTAFFWFITEDSDDAYFFVMLMAGVFAFISVAAYLATQSRINTRKKQSHGEVIIADNCLALNSEFHIWKGMGNILESVNYYEADRMIEFTYSIVARGGRQFVDVRVPVPANEKEQLQKVLNHFGIKPLSYKPVNPDEEEISSGETLFTEKQKDEDEGFELKF